MISMRPHDTQMEKQTGKQADRQTETMTERVELERGRDKKNLGRMTDASV